MHFSLTAALGVILLAPLVAAAPLTAAKESKFDIVFRNWGKEKCHGDEVGNSTKLESMQCYSW